MRTETSNARGALVGSAGATLSATATDGTVYSLAIPGGALRKPTQIALYPVSGVTTLPSLDTLIAGVQFAPNGLALDLPATLTITLPASDQAMRAGGLLWGGDGQAVQAYPAEVTNGAATMQIFHFSGAGLGTSGNPPVVPASCSSGADMFTILNIDVSTVSFVGQTPTIRSAFVGDLRECWHDLVGPEMTAFASRTLETADLNDYLPYSQAFTATKLDYGLWLWVSDIAEHYFPGSTSDLVSSTRPAAAMSLQAWYAETNGWCAANASRDNVDSASLSMLGVWGAHTMAPSWHVDTTANRLDYESLLDDACARIVIDPSRSFSGAKPGDDGTVTVPVGYSLQGGPVLHDLKIDVRLTLTGSSTPFAEGPAPSDGVFTAPLSWPDDADPLKIDVLAHFEPLSDTDDISPSVARFDRITKSPGSKLALSVRDTSNHARIAVMNADGSNLQYLTDGPADAVPAWSPDGSRIAFARTNGLQGTEIEVMNADGSDVTPLTSGPADNTSPDWSPDGTRIAFLRYSAVPPDFTIVIMNADGSNVVDTQIKVYSAYGRVSWSPDGQQLVYSNPDGDPGTTPTRLWIVNASGGTATKLDTSACQNLAGFATWAPTSAMIAFDCQSGSGSTGSDVIAVGTATAGGARAVTSNYFGKAILRPTWSPDGTKIAFGVGPNIVIQDLAGGGASTINVGGISVDQVDWGP